MTGHRAERVADLVLRVLARTVREELRDPRVGFVTLTDVKLSPDLRHAVVFVTFMGQDEREAALGALNHAAPFLRRRLARGAGLRFTPELRFAHDDAAERGIRVERILGEIRRERSSGAPGEQDDGGDEASR